MTSTVRPARSLRPVRAVHTVHAASAAGLLLLCALLYARALPADFVLDDWDNVVHNPYVHWNSLSGDRWIGAALGPAVKRPVAHWSFGLNHYFSGLDVRGFRALNVAIHGANALLVYALALSLFRGVAGRRGTRAVGPALLAAALFAAHPLQIQAVTYVVQRMSSLATAFYLLALLAFARARLAPPGWRRRLAWLGVGACGLLALGSKEIAAALPAALLLYDGWILERPDRGWWRRRAPWWAALFTLALAGCLVAAGSPRYAQLDFGPGERLLTQARVAWHSLSLFVLPLPSRLNLLHVVEPSRSLVQPWTTLPSVAGLLGLLGLALWLAPRARIPSFALLWLLLHLAIEGSTLPLRMMFEHRLYLPLVGLCLLPAWALDRARQARPRLAAALGLLLLVLLSAATLARNETWRDSTALWLDVAAKSPSDPTARMQRGSVLARHGQLAAALQEVEVAASLDPHSARPHNLRASVLQALDRPEEAVMAYRQAIALEPAATSARTRLAELLWQLGREGEALAEQEELLARSPGLAAPELRLARMLVTTTDASLRDPERALALARSGTSRRRDAWALDTLALCQAAVGRTAEAAATAAAAAARARAEGRPELAAEIEVRRSGATGP